MKTRILTALTACLLLPFAVWADEGDPISVQTNLIDIPTAHALDRYQTSFQTRAYEHGAIMETIDFGVYPRINIGVSIAANELLGSSHSVRVLSPDFQAKWKVYDGNLYMPAIAVGYDGRRYGYGYTKHRVYNPHTKKYMDDRKGGYVAFTREILVPGFHASAGVNLSDFDLEKFYGFAGIFYTVLDQVSLMMEWDNIHNIRDSRWNAGARFYLHPSLALDAAVRRIGRGDESERILQLRYVTTF